MEENMLSISIIIPFYNSDKNLFITCFESIVNQTYKNFEVIIIDDGSKHEFATFLDEIAKQDSRVIVFHQENGGVSCARNKGIDLARGKTICFVDADDYLAPWMLEDLWNAYINKQVVAVAAYYKSTFDNFLEFKRKSNDIKLIKSYLMKDTALIGMNCIPKPEGFLSAGPYAVLYKSEVAKKIHFPVGIKYMEDVIWNYKFFDISQDLDVCILNETVYAYRQNAQSASHTYKTQVVKDRIRSLKYMKNMGLNNNNNFAVRVFSNYVSCCKGLMLTSEYKGIGIRIKGIKKMSRHSIWRYFKKRGVDKSWPIKMRIKRILAISGLLPFAYVIKRK